MKHISTSVIQNKSSLTLAFYTVDELDKNLELIRDWLDYFYGGCYCVSAIPEHRPLESMQQVRRVTANPKRVFDGVTLTRYENLFTLVVGILRKELEEKRTVLISAESFDED